MKIKGLAREKKWRKRRYGMQVDGANMVRVHLDLAQKRNKKRAK
jgi:hypothetical protein